ncbi:hypothetical protein [Elizabethkingia sp. M8]|uniref:hypothetical protein n=1 Tax=Elizabethkingia sp. M8 TaxID=2796140 RepID=UPI001907DB5B|nr:hypothetical protein [Elizabethkingia sp. M8]QQM25638.1 hypothetical protein JCR23_12135 [Elizabethkingia sp. M8]
MKKIFFSTTLLFVCTFSYSQYRDPVQPNLSPMFRAQSILQQRYDYNVQRVQETINDIFSRVYKFDIPSEQKEEIIRRFKEVPLKSINSQSINYSDNNTTNDVINYLYESINKITHQVTD